MRPSCWTIVLLVAAHHRHRHRCHALAAQTPRGTIVSRKSDGRYKTFSLDNLEANADGGNVGEVRGSSKGSFRPSTTLRRVRSTFLPNAPRGALHQTGYLRYILYDNLQDLSTSLRSVLATQRILEGVGVGRSGATALSATLNFIIRDGCGMVASLLFTSYAARGFRRNVKRWRFFADVMVDLGITLEIVAPSLAEGWFLPLLCLGNVCKALCGVAAGACGGALQMHWAVQVMGTEEGISEVAAKNGAQRTVVGGVGLVSAALIAKWLGGRDLRIAIGFYCALTLVHLMASYRSLKLVALDWLNGWRLHLVVNEFLDCLNDEEGSGNTCSVVVSAPADASRKEPLLFLPEWRAIKSSQYPIQLGVSCNKLVQCSYRRASLLRFELSKRDNLRNDNYILALGDAGGNKQSIMVAFFSESSNAEKAKAYLHGCLVRRALCREKDCKDDGSESTQKVEEAAASELARLWPMFERCVTDTGWILDKTECSTEGYEMHYE